MMVTTSTERVDGVRVSAGFLRKQSRVSWNAMIRRAIINIMVNSLSCVCEKDSSNKTQRSSCSAVHIMSEGA